MATVGDLWALSVFPKERLSVEIPCADAQEKTATLTKIIKKVAQLYGAYFDGQGPSEMFPGKRIAFQKTLSQQEIERLKEKFEELLKKKIEEKEQQLTEYKLTNYEIVLCTQDYSTELLGKAVRATKSDFPNQTLDDRYRGIFDALIFDERRKIDIEWNKKEHHFKVVISDGGPTNAFYF